MTTTGLSAAELRTRLDELTAKYDVPGAVVGLLVDDELTVCATGVTRRDGDGAPVTPDTLFLIASITKVWTATLVMQFVDEGRIALDDPVNRHLSPRLSLADESVADAVTVRQLLTHTGGFMGDSDEPTYRDDDAVEKMVAGYDDLPQLHRPGSLFSYSNTGYTVLGRLVECLAGTTWDEALHQRIATPLGLTRTFNLPERAMVHRVAVGHERLAGSTALTPVEVWNDSRGTGPCGSTLTTRAADLLAFARMHLRDGRGPDGKQVLSPDAARLMRKPQVAMADPVFGDAWGLGWEVPRTAEPTVIGHGGNTNGQLSQLYLVPDRGLAMCVLTNGDVTGQLREKLCDEMLAAGAGVTLAHTPAPAPPGTAVDLSPFLGTFGREDIKLSFRTVDAGLEVECFTAGDIARSVADFTTPLAYAAGSTFLLPLPGLEEHPTPLTFIREDGDAGPVTHIALGGRVLPLLAGS